MRGFIQFLKTNSYMITKMVINQVGMTIFGLVLAMATSQNEKLLLLTSVFSICFYMFLLYTMSWENGISDKIRLDAGRIEYKPFKFVWISLCANVVNLILGILAVVGYVFIDKIGESWSTPLWAVNLYGFCNAVARFIQGMYLGVIQFFTPNNPISLVLIVLPSLVVCGGGYWLGLRGRSMRNLIGLKTGNETPAARPPKKD